MNKQEVIRQAIEDLKACKPAMCAMVAMEKELDMAISALEQQLNGGWIPCKSKLPDKVHMKYLVTMKHKHFNEYYIDCRNLYSDYQFEFENNFERHNWDVVAWQPLPEPYKELATDNNVVTKSGKDNNVLTIGDKIRESNESLAEFIKQQYGDDRIFVNGIEYDIDDYLNQICDETN